MTSAVLLKHVINSFDTIKQSAFFSQYKHINNIMLKYIIHKKTRTNVTSIHKAITV